MVLDRIAGHVLAREVAPVLPDLLLLFVFRFDLFPLVCGCSLSYALEGY